MIYHQEISPFTTVGKSFEEYFFFNGYVFVYHEGKICKKTIIFPNSRNSFLHLKKKHLVIKNTGMCKRHQEVDKKLVAGLHDTPILLCKVIIL